MSHHERTTALLGLAAHLVVMAGCVVALAHLEAGIVVIATGASLYASAFVRAFTTATSDGHQRLTVVTVVSAPAPDVERLTESVRRAVHVALGREPAKPADGGLN